MSQGLRGGAVSFPSQSDIVERIEQDILAGTLPVGAKLPSERELGRQFGVSRPVVREALRGLEERGYIQVFPNRGSFVREVSGSDLAEPLARLVRRVGVTPRQIVAARTVLECAAAEHAAWDAGPDDIDEIRRALEEHTAAQDIQGQVATDLAFHEAIVRATGNPVLAIMYGSIRGFVLGIMMRSQTDGLVRAAGDPLHDLILKKIEDRDAEGARDAMRRHLTLAVRLYGDDIDKSLDDVLKSRQTQLSDPGGWEPPTRG